MKTKSILLSLLLGFIFFACEDDTISKVGTGIQPETDKVKVYDDSVTITARTIKVDAIYAKTVNGLLGEFYDPSYGTIKAGYICQYYPSYGFTDIDSIVDNKIDSIFLSIRYTTYKGDSLAPMELSVYRVKDVLPRDYYTDVDPIDFCDSEPIAKYGYTARNMNMSDSLLSVNGNTHSISILLPREIGQSFLDEAKKPKPNIYDPDSIQSFSNFFGTYLTTSFGVGSLLYVDDTQLFVYYRTKAGLKIEGGDSIQYKTTVFPVTKEVIQLNSLKNVNASLLEDNDEKMFVKSPGGVFTELTIPLREIIDSIGKKRFNSVKLSLTAEPQDKWEHAMEFPGTSTFSLSNTYYRSQLLLISPDSVKNFFELQNVADNITAYTTTFNSTTYTYNFENIANLIQNAINENTKLEQEGKTPKEELKLLLVPVLTAFSYQQSYTGASTPVDYSTSHYLRPSAVTLKKGGNSLKVRIIASD
jgi:hypothetical protein